MKERIFGLQKTSINKLLKKLEKDFLFEKNQLEYDLQNIVIENEKMQANLLEIANKSALQVEDELLELGKKRIKKVIKYLNMQKEAEIVGLRREFDQKVKLINDQQKKIDSEIESLEELYSRLLNQLTSLIEQSENTKANDFIEKQIGKNQEETDEPVDTPVGGSFNQTKISDKEDESRNILNIEKKDIKYKNDLLENLQQNKIQEQSTSIEERNPVHLQETGNEGWKDTSTSSHNIQDASHKQKDQSDLESFWGNLEEDTFDFMKEEQGFNGNLFNTIDKEFNEIEKAGKTSKNNELKKDNLEKSDESINEPVEHINKKPNLDDHLIKQIDSIKSQYIVGKVAGEDLFDHHGNMIVSKFGLITQEVVEKANSAGILAELIINMKISGLGDD